MNFRKASDGSLFVPSRGKPPEPPHGYQTSDYSPFVFVPILTPCIFRQQKEVKYKCCRQPKTETHCALVERKITMGECHICEQTKMENIKNEVRSLQATTDPGDT